MNIHGWHPFSPRKHSDRPSPLAGVLPRVRAIREPHDELSSANTASRKQRRERLLDAQRRISYRPIPQGVVPDPVPARRYWLHRVAPFALLCAAVVWAVWTAEVSDRDVGNVSGRDVSRGFVYRLSGTQPFLSEHLAITKAAEALSQVVIGQTAWTPIERRDGKGTKAPDGTRDVYLFRHVRTNLNVGIILFDSTRRHTDTVLAVNVQLQGAELSCTVSRAR